LRGRGLEEGECQGELRGGRRGKEGRAGRRGGDCLLLFPFVLSSCSPSTVTPLFRILLFSQFHSPCSSPAPVLTISHSPSLSSQFHSLSSQSQFYSLFSHSHTPLPPISHSLHHSPSLSSQSDHNSNNFSSPPQNGNPILQGMRQHALPKN